MREKIKTFKVDESTGEWLGELVDGEKNTDDGLV